MFWRFAWYNCGFRFAITGERQNMAIGKELFDRLRIALELIQDSHNPRIDWLFENPALLVR